MEICPIPSKICLSRLKIVPNDKWRFRKLPNTFKIWPKCQIFAKSGHTAASPLRIASQVVRLSQLRQQVGSRQLSTLGTPRSWPENTYRSESITVELLVSSLTGFDQNILLIARSKEIESKAAKLEISWIVILPPTVTILGLDERERSYPDKSALSANVQMCQCLRPRINWQCKPDFFVLLSMLYLKATYESYKFEWEIQIQCNY